MTQPDVLKSLVRNPVPWRSVAILSSGGSEVDKQLRAWALVQLIVWASSDCRSSTSKDQKTKTKRRSKKNVRRAGFLFICHLMGQPNHLSAGESLKILSLFRVSGGFSAVTKGVGAHSILKQVKGSITELNYVYEIVDFMCRYRKHCPEGLLLQIDTAKRFVENFFRPPGLKPYRFSKISQIWESHKLASPFIFAALPLLRQLETIRSGPVAMNRAQHVAANPRLTQALMKRAAFAASIISTRAHGLRVEDYEEIDPRERYLAPFSDDELKYLREYDRGAPIKGRDFRAKRLKRQIT